MVNAVPVRELELDLDAFEGPFDLLLSLVLREELPLAELDLAEIVVAFVTRLAERDELDLEACGEFLVLFSALLELKARGLCPEEADELSELGPEEAAEELARRLAEYRRAKEAAKWLVERLETPRYFRIGPGPLAPLAPEPEQPVHREAGELALQVVEGSVEGGARSLLSSRQPSGELSCIPGAAQSRRTGRPKSLLSWRAGW